MSLNKIFVNNTLVASVDSEPTTGSDNLVKSRGVADAEKYNNYKCSALETIIFGAKNAKACNINGWLNIDSNVMNMTSADSRTLIISVVPGDVIECTQSNDINVAFIKDFTLARTYPVVRSSEYPQSLQDPSHVVAPDDAKYCFISYKYYNLAQRGIETVKFNGTFLSYEAVNIKGLKDDIVVLQNGGFDKLINFGEFRTVFNTRHTSPFALLCTEDGNVTSFQLKLLESNTVTISVCKSVDDKEVLSSRTFTLPAGTNTVELDEPMPVLNGNMVMCENAVSCYGQDTQSEDIFYSVGSSEFVKRGDYVRFTFGFTVKHSLNAFLLEDAIKEETQRAILAEANLKNELENVEDGNFSLKETVGDSTTALTFNAVQSAGLLCSRDGIINDAIIHTGEASTVTIAVYESKDSANLISTKQVQLEAGVNKLSNLNISVNKGNIIFVSGTKLTYRVYSSEDSIFYMLVNDTYFGLRGDHVRFEVAFTIIKNIDLYDIAEEVEKIDNITNGNFSKLYTIGDKSTALTFNAVQSTALLCESSGIINKAIIHTGEASTAIIEVYKAVDDVTLLSSKEVQLQAGVNHLDNLNIRVLDGNIIYVSGTKLTYRVPQNLDSIFYTKSAYGFGLRSDHVRFEVSYEIDSSVNTFDLYTDVEVLKEEVADLTPIETQYITITPGNDNYNLIRNTIASITDATANKPYVVIVPEGEYVECDLQGKKYVTIRGENRNRVIIRNDGTSTTKVTPSDYFWPDYANMPLNEIPKAEKHIVAPKDNIIIENCTLIANECKYVVHGENSGWYKTTFKNCELIATNCNYTVGLGLRHIQHIEFVDCHLTSGNGVSGIMYYHNWTWQQTTGHIPLYSGGCKASYKNCKLTFSTDAWLILDELASRNDDIAFFENCELDYSSSVNPHVQFRVNVISGGVSNAIDLNGNRYTVLEDVPYCMRLIAVKSGFTGMSIEKHNRPLAEDYVQIVD